MILSTNVVKPFEYSDMFVDWTNRIDSIIEFATMALKYLGRLFFIPDMN